MNPPFFSVVIPLYNKQDYILKTLRSVLDQSFTDFEVIIVNDGSTDSSFNLVNKVNDSRLKVYNKNNEGVSVARNYGIQKATTEWIAFLDSDDEWEPNYLQNIYDNIHEIPSGDVFYTITRSIKKNCVEQFVPLDTDEASVIDYFDFILTRNGQKMSSSSTVVKKPCFEQAGYFPAGVKVGEDTDTWIRLAWLYNVCFIPKALVNVNWQASNSNWQNTSDWDIITKTFKDWKRLNKIPHHKFTSSMRFYQDYIIKENVQIALSGNRCRASIQLIGNVNPCYTDYTRFIKAIIHITIPKSFICALKKLVNI